MPFMGFLLRELPVWYLWVALSPAIVWVSWRYPVRGPRRLLHLGVHSVFAVVCVMTALALASLYQFIFFVPPELSKITFLEWYLVGLTQHAGAFLIVYASVAAAQHAAIYSLQLEQRTLQAARLETRLTRAQLDVLKTQLQPHFLFNTLNTVYSLMHSNVPAAQDTVLRLSDLLRRSLRNAASHEVPLSEELEFLEEYVAIQKTRFADRLEVEFDIDPATPGLLVPRLLLQPLLENAIRHGLQPQESPGTIRVLSRLQGERLRLEVVDNGVGLTRDPAGDHPDGGIGLRNTRARLAQLYGAAHEFSLEEVEPHGVRVRIVMPAREADHTAEIIGGGEDD
jgi:sensor histidine kinase YesM